MESASAQHSEGMWKTLADLFLLKPSLPHMWLLCEGRNVRLLSKAAARECGPSAPLIYLLMVLCSTWVKESDKQSSFHRF